MDQSEWLSFATAIFLRNTLVLGSVQVRLIFGRLFVHFCEGVP